MNQQLNKTIAELSDIEPIHNICHINGNLLPMPSVEMLKEVVNTTRALLFPGYYGDSRVNEQNIEQHITLNISRLQELLQKQIQSGLCFEHQNPCSEILEKCAAAMTEQFIETLPELRRQLHQDVVSSYNGDPAAKSFGEVIYCYPGIRAVCNYRIAHELLKLGVPLIPRIITEMAHSETGIDIHPAAQIGSFFTIDHGTGVVIGETAVIGNNVKIYQGVTLGARSFPLDENGYPIKGIKRHPNIGNDVIIYSNSTILGNITVGDGAIIGGNIWVTEDVATGARLVQKK
ncbi:MAG: serine acetyltransferase [Paludibacter sp.]|nr:serine acetyltransferase [Paludibacter sp.]